MMIHLILLPTLLLSVTATPSFHCPEFCECTGGFTKRMKCSESLLQSHAPVQGTIHLRVETKDSNTFRELRDHHFSALGLSVLHTLDVSNGGMISVHVAAFSGLTELVEVNMSHNHLTALHPNTFMDNTKLKYLDLSNNPLQLRGSSEASEENVFLKCPSLTKLSLSNCGITFVPPSAFSQLINLELLDLSNNNIASLTYGMFTNLAMLNDVDLSNNYIKSIEKQTFKDVEDMTVLTLRNNPLDDLANLTAYGIKSLDVSYCNIKTLKESTFLGITSLSSLNLENNNISELHPKAFLKLKKLTNIDLSHNSLRSIPPTIFDGNRKLERIDFKSNNFLTHIPELVGDFTYLTNYDVSNCAVTNISSSTFRTMRYLKSFNGSLNKIQFIASSTFNDLWKIKVLDLSLNNISHISDNAFGNNHELQYLNLSGNPFVNLTASTFEGALKLYSLNLSRTGLTSSWIDEKSIEMIKSKRVFNNLAVLDISKNLVTTAHKDQFSHINSLLVLDVRDNPLSCNESFLPFLKHLIKYNVLPYTDTSNDDSGSHFWRMLMRELCDFPHSHNFISGGLNEAKYTEPIGEIHLNEHNNNEQINDETSILPNYDVLSYNSKVIISVIIFCIIAFTGFYLANLSIRLIMNRANAIKNKKRYIRNNLRYDHLNTSWVKGSPYKETTERIVFVWPGSKV